MNDIKFKSTFDKIEFDIDMKMYMKHNSKIASIYDNLGDAYSYKDLEYATLLEKYDTLQEYKKILKEKCDAFDKAIEHLHKINEQNKSALTNKEQTIISKHELLNLEIINNKILENILRGEDNE